MTIANTISPVNGPSPESPGTWDADADEFVQAMEGLPLELNAWAEQVNTTQAIMTFYAGQASDAKIAAEAARDTAALTAGAAPYSSGATYNTTDAVIGSDGHTYRCLSDGVTGDDPVGSGTGNWLRLTVGAGGVWTVVTNADSPYQAKSGDRLAVDTTAGAVTVTLPASPVIGDQVRFLDLGGSWADDHLTVGRNAKTIQGLAEDLVADRSDRVFSLVYFSSADDWRLSA